MKRAFGAVLALVAGTAAARPGPVRITDVPASHWARSPVEAVLARGVMSAPGGKFHGDRKVTRSELAVTLASLARALERKAWPRDTQRPVKDQPLGAAGRAQSVNRYVLAAVMDRVARFVAQGLPAPGAKPFLGSDAFPARPKVAVPAADPASESVRYLVQNHMAFGASVALKPGPEPVTARELADAMAMMIAGLNDRVTDEPQNREDPGPPPARKK